jgi:DNA-binding Xre family transcriptional regulator
MTLEEICKALSDRNLRVVSDRTGIKYPKLWRLANGETKRPLLEDIEKLRSYLEKP